MAVELQPRGLLADPRGVDLLGPDRDAKCGHDGLQRVTILRHFSSQALQDSVRRRALV